MAASLAGEKIIMQSATLLMIPEPSAFTFVTAEEHCAGAGALDKTTEVICRGPRPRDGASGPKGCGLSEGVDPADIRGGGAFLVFIVTGRLPPPA